MTKNVKNIVYIVGKCLVINQDLKFTHNKNIKQIKYMIVGNVKGNLNIGIVAKHMLHAVAITPRVS